MVVTQDQLDSFSHDFDKPFTYQIISIASFSFTFILSLTSLVTAWVIVFFVYFKCQQKLCSIKEKLSIACSVLESRKFPDDVMRTLGEKANFDADLNETEIQSLLKHAPQNIIDSDKS